MQSHLLLEVKVAFPCTCRNVRQAASSRRKGRMYSKRSDISTWKDKQGKARPGIGQASQNSREAEWSLGGC